MRSMPALSHHQQAAVTPFPDVEAGAEETSAREINRMLRAGWRLLQVIHAHDGGGYPVYMVGKSRS